MLEDFTKRSREVSRRKNLPSYAGHQQFRGGKPHEPVQQVGNANMRWDIQEHRPLAERKDGKLPQPWEKVTVEKGYYFRNRKTGALQSVPAAKAASLGRLSRGLLSEEQWEKTVHGWQATTH